MLQVMVRIEGARVVLREWRREELDAMHRWLGNPEVTRFLSWGALTREDSARHLAACVANEHAADRQHYFLAIELKESGRVIGDAGFQWTGNSERGHEGSLGYFLEPAFWRQGYATEAAEMVLEIAFGTYGAVVMRASCNSGNTASERVMQRIGMRRDEAGEAAGRRAYAISRDDWHKRKR
jgi:RimJ/RimL family protein N-acetyltransferase